MPSSGSLCVWFPVLQTLPGHLTLDISGRAAPALTFSSRLALSEAGVQRGEDPAQHCQHQEHCRDNVSIRIRVIIEG